MNFFLNLILFFYLLNCVSNFEWSNILNPFSIFGKNKKANKDNEYCYPPLDCYKETYHEEKNLPTVGWFKPDPPDQLGINLIYFNDLKTKGQKLKYNSTNVKRFLVDKRTYFIIHGWQSGFEYENWIDQMKQTILAMNNNLVNVFVVDWNKSASTINYPQAAENVKVVGPAIGYFITNTLVKKYGLICDNVVVLGHSLGGQAAGFVGLYAQGHNCKIGIIVALDPAGPYFRSENDLNSRVNYRDGPYVEAVHTNAGNNTLAGLGTTLRSGLVDYYINGGETQVGCDLKNAIGNAIKNGIDLNGPSCSHIRAPLIYSIYYDKLTSCQLIGYQCKDYDSFKKGECGDCGEDNMRCRLIGMSKYHDPRMIPPPKLDEYYYVSTTAEPPYCQHTYQIKVTTSSISNTIIGNFYLNIIGRARDAFDIKIEGPITGLEANKSYTFLLEKELPLEELKKIQIYFDQSIIGSVVSIGNEIEVSVIEVQVNYMSHISSEIRKKYSGKFLNKNDQLISTSKQNQTEFFISSN